MAPLKLYLRSEAPADYTRDFTKEEIATAGRLLKVGPDEVEFHPVLLMPGTSREAKLYWNYFHTQAEDDKREAIIPLMMSEEDFSDRTGFGTDPQDIQKALAEFSRSVTDKGFPKWICMMSFLKSDKMPASDSDVPLFPGVGTS